MTPRTMRRWAGGAIVTALVLGVLGVLAGASPASARLVAIDMTFEQLMPGERRSDSAAVTLPREARLVDVVVGEEEAPRGAFAWEAELCPPRGACLPVATSSEGARLAAGSHTLRVEVTLADDAPALASSTVSGRLLFTEVESEGLPPTGTTTTLLGVALVALAVGATLVALARRSRQEVPRG